MIFNEMLKLAKIPNFNNLLKVENELRSKGVKLTPRHKLYLLGELGKLCKNINFNYKEEQDRILRERFEPLLIQKYPELTIRDVVLNFGLKYTKKNKWSMENLIYRCFRKDVNKRKISSIREFLRNNCDQ